MATMDEELCSRDLHLRLLKEHLHKAKNNMKKYADLDPTEREIKVGDFFLPLIITLLVELN